MKRLFIKEEKASSKARHNQAASAPVLVADHEGVLSEIFTANRCRILCGIQRGYLNGDGRW
jgi:hypothetical protein